jgi:hypothetical protein
MRPTATLLMGLVAGLFAGAAFLGGRRLTRRDEPAPDPAP